MKNNTKLLGRISIQSNSNLLTVISKLPETACCIQENSPPPPPMKCSFLLKSLSCNISLHYRVVPVPTGGWPPLHSRLLQVHAELRFGLKMNGIPDRWTAKHGRHCSGQRDGSGEDLQDQVQSGWTTLSAAPYLKWVLPALPLKPRQLSLSL